MTARRIATGLALCAALALACSGTARAQAYPSRPITVIVPVLHDSAITARLQAMGVTPVGGPPAQLRSFMATQSARWGQVIKEAGIKLE